MRTVTIPHTDVRVSRICLGTGSMGAEMSEGDSFYGLDAFVEAGGTFLDTRMSTGTGCPASSTRVSGHGPVAGPTGQRIG